MRALRYLTWVAGLLAGCALPGGDPVPVGGAAISKIPNLTITTAWDGTQITLPPPIDADRMVFNTPQYRQWQFRGSGSEFTLPEASGGSYEVKTVGKNDSFRTIKTVREPVTDEKKKPGKKGKDELITGHGVRLIVAHYRPDGTLDNVTTYRPDASIHGWITYTADGQSRQVLVLMRSASECPPGMALIKTVRFFEPERIRQLQVSSKSVAWQELVVTETGAVRNRLHEDATKADPLVKLGEPLKPDGK